MRKCFSCAQEVEDDAIICPHCSKISCKVTVVTVESAEKVQMRRLKKNMALVNQTRFTDESLKDFLCQVLWWHKAVFPPVPKPLPKSLSVTVIYQPRRQMHLSGFAVHAAGMITLKFPKDHTHVHMPSLAWIFSHELWHLQGIHEHSQMSEAVNNWGHTVNADLWGWAVKHNLEVKGQESPSQGRDRGEGTPAPEGRANRTHFRRVRTMNPLRGGAL